MDETITVVTDPTDFNREGRLPMSRLFTFAEMARRKSFYSGLLADMVSFTGGTIVVKAQAYHFASGFDGLLDTFLEIKPVNLLVEQRMVSIGKTSFVLRYQFTRLADDKLTRLSLLAYGYAAIVSVANGHPCAIPEDIHSRMVQGIVQDEESSILRSTGNTLADKIKANDVITATLKAKLRSSDEDSTPHVNHARYCQLFEDAARLVDPSPPCFMYLDYVKETKRGMTCSLTVRLSNTTDKEGVVQMEHDGGVICQGVVRWRASPEGRL